MYKFDLNSLNFTGGGSFLSFLKSNKYIILAGITLGIFANAIDIFTFKFGADAEYYAFVSDEIYLEQNRYGSAILYYILPFARYHIISQITGIIALTFAGLLTVSRHNIPYSAKLLFVLLFVTYPNFAFLQYFYFQSAYNFVGLLFVVIAYRIIESSKNIILLTISIILLFIGITSYQSNFAVFLTVIMINVILDYMDDKNITNALKKIFKYSLYLIVTIVLYYISIKILSSNFS